MPDASVAIDDFILALSTASTAHGIYPPAHPQANASLERVVESLNNALEAREKDTISLMLVDDDLAVDGKPWNRASSNPSGLVRSLERAGIESVRVRALATSAELKELVLSLAGQTEVQNSDNVSVGRVVVATGGVDAGWSRVGTLEDHLDSTQRALDEFKLDSTKGFQRLEREVWGLVEATADESRTFALLASIRRDEDRLWRHAMNVCLYSTYFARALGIAGSLQHDLAVGGLLHDIGYLSIAGDVGQMTAEQRRLHPEMGAVRLSSVAGTPPLAVLIAYEHHIYWDGSAGYPAVKRKPNLGSQIIAVADSWDMLMDISSLMAPEARHTKVVEQMRRISGTFLNANLVSPFLDLMTAAPMDLHSK